MKEKGTALYRSFSSDQLRTLLDAQQLFEAWSDAMHRLHSLRGGMHWKSAGGKQYLFRTRDRRGYGKSLGPRSAETEKILQIFRKDKAQAREREAALRRRLADHARFCKAARIARVPRLSAALARELSAVGLGDAVMIVGTNALYAYEAACGVQIVSSSRLETRDLDLLLDSRRSVELLVEEVRREGLIGLLRKVDKSFAIIQRQDFRAVNDDGFMVDLIRPMPKLLRKNPPDMLGRRGDLKAADIEHLEWYLSAPKFRQTIIGDDGYPAPFTVPDPRVFALHKLWLSRERGRDPLKKPKDREQAFLVAELTVRYLPQLEFSGRELRMLPREVASLAGELIDRAKAETEA